VSIQKKNRKRVIIGAVLLLALSLFYLKPIIFDSEKDLPKPADKSITMEPQFSNEGNLVFMNAQKDSILVVDIEIADKDQERTQGMMFRSAMSYDRAMLFIMQYERVQSFWMRNTKMSLDIMYVSGDKEIVTIYKHTQPYSESPIPSFKKAKYVVETAAGFCDKYGIKEGNFIEFARVDL
jgi:uncharacterized membrane protein (UPF0127 family)